HSSITAAVVPDEFRIGCWPQHLGSVPHWITIEPRIFALMDRLCAGYHGGIWSFSPLSIGGGFMAPEAEHDVKWTLCISMNGNGRELTSE
ncbi:antirestriction protein, partial [Klebsiella quasipneumoniae]|uniref:antirestriction protein n=1 Tax=Klebsiella quasipneumoniae TaxID=1463165 RepID=UPI0011123A1F